MRETAREFRYSRRFDRGVVGEDFVSSNVSAVWMRGGESETLINGTLQGRKQFDARGASMLCRRKMWALGIKIVGAAVGMQGGQSVKAALDVKTYREVKMSKLLEKRRKVKEEVRQVLGGWIRNEGGDLFSLEEQETSLKRDP